MVANDITFHPVWWAQRGFSFTRRFFEDANYRMEIDREMRRVLFEEYGHVSMGDKNPLPRPLVDSDLLAGDFVQAQVMGCEIDFEEKSLPYTVSRDIEDSEIESVLSQDIIQSKAWQVYQKQYEDLINRFGRVESYMDMHGVQNLALGLRGTQLYEDYICEPEQAIKVLQASYRCIELITKAVLQFTASTCIGVSANVRRFDPNIYLTSNCTCEMISQDMYEEFLLPFDLQLAQFKPFGIHHCGQTMQRLAQAYSRIKPAFIEVGAFSDIAQTLQWFTPNTMVNLRYSPRDLAVKKADEIVKDLQTMHQKAQNFEQVGISCVGVDETTPKENIERFLNFCAENNSIN